MFTGSLNKTIKAKITLHSMYSMANIMKDFWKFLVNKQISNDLCKDLANTNTNDQYKEGFL